MGDFPSACVCPRPLVIVVFIDRLYIKTGSFKVVSEVKTSSILKKIAFTKWFTIKGTTCMSHRSEFIYRCGYFVRAISRIHVHLHFYEYNVGLSFLYREAPKKKSTGGVAMWADKGMRNPLENMIWKKEGKRGKRREKEICREFFFAWSLPHTIFFNYLVKPVTPTPDETRTMLSNIFWAVIGEIQ